MKYVYVIKTETAVVSCDVSLKYMNIKEETKNQLLYKAIH